MMRVQKKGILISLLLLAFSIKAEGTSYETKVICHPQKKGGPSDIVNFFQKSFAVLCDPQSIGLGVPFLRHPQSHPNPHLPHMLQSIDCGNPARLKEVCNKNWPSMCNQSSPCTTTLQITKVPENNVGGDNVPRL